MTWTKKRSSAYGARWQKARQYVLKRDKGLCQMCKRVGKITPGKEVDHIIPISQGGPFYNLSNLEVICRRHHALKTQAESMGRDYNQRGCSADGIPNDPKHHWGQGGIHPQSRPS